MGGRHLGALTLRPVTQPVVREPMAKTRLIGGERTARRVMGFTAVQACTVASLLMGITAIMLSTQGRFRLALACLVACVVFDGLDGNLARKMNVATPFGAQMDSLADMASFGMSTPLVLYFWLASHGSVWMAGPACAAMSVSAALRLARFNVSPYNGTWFQGLPTTIAALIVVGITLVVPSFPVWAFSLLIVLCAAAMWSSMPYPKLAQVFRLRPWLLAVVAAAAILNPQVTFLVIVSCYLLSGPINYLAGRWATTQVTTELLTTD